MVKNTNIFIIILVLGIFFLPSLVLSQDYQLLQPEVVDGASGEFGAYAEALITTILVVAAVLAVIMFVWGGIEYTISSVPGIKTEGLNRIWAALGGLLIALTAWLILNTINPNLLTFNLDNIGQAGIGGGITNPGGGSGRPTRPGTPPSTGGGGSPSSAQEQEVRTRLGNAGFEFNNGPCPPGSNGVGCTNLAGLQPTTESGLIQLKQDAGLETLTITGGTEPGHAGGQYSHANGYKIDLSRNSNQEQWETLTNTLNQATNQNHIGNNEVPGTLSNGQEIRVRRHGPSDHYDITFLP